MRHHHRFMHPDAFAAAEDFDDDQPFLDDDGEGQQAAAAMPFVMPPMAFEQPDIEPIPVAVETTPIVIDPPAMELPPMPRGKDRYPHTGPLSDALIYPGHGYPENPGENRPGLSPFGRLAKKQALGKTSLLYYDGGNPNVQPAGVSILQVEGDNLDAQQLVVTLAPPRVIPLAYAAALERAERIGPQNLSNEQDNSQVSDTNFPGTVSALAWPPLEAEVEWGVGGMSSKAVIDYVNGVTFSVVASFLRVTALVSQSTESGGIAGTSAVYQLGGNVGPGFACDCAQRTVFVGTLAADEESTVFNVPFFAKSALVVGCDRNTPPALAVAYLRFWQRPTKDLCVGNFFSSGNTNPAFRVPNAGQYFTVLNQSGSPMLFNVIFELALK